MGFFHFDNKAPQALLGGQLSRDFLQRGECKVCPLNNCDGLKHPKMPATGNKHPLVYMLGEAPGAEEDDKGRQFVGKSGRVLRFRIQRDWLEHIRWNNCVRTRPPNNRTPTEVELECCRPSIVRDIEATKPKAIFGFGGVPLKWAINESRITVWSGRWLPLKVGTHTCWFFPMMHPSYVMRLRKFVPRKTSDYGSEAEFAFARDLARAFKVVEHLPDPIVHTEQQALEDIDCITGENGEQDLEMVRQFLTETSKRKLAGVDYETNCLRPYQKDSRILTAALSTDVRTMAFAMDHQHAKWSESQYDRLMQMWQNFLYEAKCRKISHHLAFEQEWSAVFFGHGCLRSSVWEDTASQSYILDERQGGHSLEFLCWQYFGLNVKAISNLDRKKLDKVLLSEVLRYNGVDARYHRLLFLEQTKRLLREGLQDVYRHHMRRVPTMVLTQIKGIPIDQKVVKAFSKKFTKQITNIEKKISDLPVVRKFFDEKGREFKPGSVPDVRYMVHEVLKKQTEKVDEVALSKIKHPFCKLILDWRSVTKLHSTYVLPVTTGSPHLFGGSVGHPILSTIKTRTWRTASEDFNSQNWPKREHRELRSQVCPGGDLRVVAFDFGQIQARNVAMESRDKALVKYFWERHDIHTDYMEHCMRLYPQWTKGHDMKDKKVIKSFRNRAKNEMVFPSFFGAQAKSVAGYLGVPQHVGEKLQEIFFDEFHDIYKWHEYLKDFYRKNGYVPSLSGFRRRAPISPNQMINAPIQADESIIVCNAMARLSEYDEPRFQANLEVHDDLTFIWPKKEIEKNAETVIDEMLKIEFPWVGIVPLVVEMGVGTDWSNIEEVGAYSSDQWNADDPFKGSWDDGTSWANHDMMENSTKRRGRPF